MKKLIYCIIIIFFISLHSCQRDYVDEVEEDTSDEINFISLVASVDTAVVYDTIYIRAYATGKDLKYKWQKNSGSLVSQDSVAIYWGCYTCMGKNTITCTVSNETGQVSKSVEVFITLK